MLPLATERAATVPFVLLLAETLLSILFFFFFLPDPFVNLYLRFQRERLLYDVLCNGISLCSSLISKELLSEEVLKFSNIYARKTNFQLTKFILFLRFSISLFSSKET